MDARAANGLTDALWKIHHLFGEINRGHKIDAKDIDELEQKIVEVEEYLEHEWENVPADYYEKEE